MKEAWARIWNGSRWIRQFDDVIRSEASFVVESRVSESELKRSFFYQLDPKVVDVMVDANEVSDPRDDWLR